MPTRLRIFSQPACQPQLSPGERKRGGVFYTPPEIVRLMVDLTLQPMLDGTLPPRVLDPACGAGEILIETQRRLIDRYGESAVRGSIVGVDIDPTAVTTARQRLQTAAPEFTSSQIITGDALDIDKLPAASFDAIIGNPPYVNIRELSKGLTPAQLARLKSTYCTARGNFDLYTLFIERAIQLLRSGGRCGLIIPNKWATLDYARPCRELLLAQATLEQIIDFTDARAFAGASVYPHVVVFRKAPATARHTIVLRDFRHVAHERVKQSQLSADAFHLSSSLDVESRAQTLQLGEVSTISCGTAGYAAQKIARRLVDDREANPKITADFITSGNIDRYDIRLGNVRYLSRDYLRPRLPLEIPELTPAKRRLFQGPKIVIAGMTRRLEAAWDQSGLALGVQVFAASRLQLDASYLLALLNSKLLSFLFAKRFAAKRLGGGYLAVNKGQLAKLPIRILELQNRQDQRRHDRLRNLAAKWEPSSEAEIDPLVYQLYRLTDQEISLVESHFAGRRAAAA